MLHTIHTTVDAHLHELRTLIRDLGRDGGLISPSVYDTAQLLRLYPPPQGVEAGLDWLASQQQSDGGWGNPDVPLARDVPTLAAVLALHTLRRDRAAQEMVKAGLAFLQDQAHQWSNVHLDLLPIAVEMILPYLIEEAHTVGLHVDRLPYRWLYQVRAKKQKMLNDVELTPALAPTYSWEALGHATPDMLIDDSGGIGHSPAATASWLQKAQARPDLAMERATAEEYLEHASAATGVAIPGVVPNVWPIVGFELVYAPYALLLTDLFDHPAVSDVLTPMSSQIEATAARNNGLSFGQNFIVDVDVTSLASLILQATGHPLNANMILQFQSDGHFFTYPHELNPSVFSNAHAIYALAMGNQRAFSAERFIESRQLHSGGWMADKWHTSWIYTTSEVISALAQCGAMETISKAGKALIDAQRFDGGWGSGSGSNAIDTSCALIALRTLRKANTPVYVEHAISRGYDWLQNHMSATPPKTTLLWMGKDLYSPYRVDRVYELCASLSIALEQVAA